MSGGVTCCLGGGLARRRRVHSRFVVPWPGIARAASHRGRIAALLLHSTPSTYPSVDEGVRCDPCRDEPSTKKTHEVWAGKNLFAFPAALSVFYRLRRPWLSKQRAILLCPS